MHFLLDHGRGNRIEARDVAHMGRARVDSDRLRSGVRHWPSMLLVLGALLASNGCAVKKSAELVDVSKALPADLRLAQEPIHLFEPVDLRARINEHRLQRRVENLFVLLDQSAAMAGTYRGFEMGDYAREILRRFNLTLPSLDLPGAVYSIDSRAAALSESFGLYPGAAHDAIAARELPPIGSTELAAAVERVGEQILGASGRSALLILTRWQRIDQAAVEAVDRLRQQIDRAHAASRSGESAVGLCVVTLGIGNTLSRSSFDRPDHCGFSMAADKAAQPREMAHFVERLLFTGPADSDGDGIYDYLDRCPGSEPNRLMTFDGCYRFGPRPGT